jgi:D-tyrosyl-tRNA(Tyr) deacylase
MRVLLQRVSRAEVRIRESNATTRVSGRIDRGYVLLVGFTATDSEDHVSWMSEKVVGLRLFSDADDKLNLALADVGGAVLVVSRRVVGRASSMPRVRRRLFPCTSGSCSDCAMLGWSWRPENSAR